jgi:hypothetical protein
MKTAALHLCSGGRPVCLEYMPPLRKAQLLSSLRRHEFGLTSNHGTASVDRAILLLLLVGDVWSVKPGLRYCRALTHPDSIHFAEASRGKDSHARGL